MAAGNDGATPTDDEWKGLGAPAGETRGIYNFNNKLIAQIVTPGVYTQGVIEHGVAFCDSTKNRPDGSKGRGDCVYIYSTPDTIETPQEAIDWATNVVPIDSSYAYLAYPWDIILDPETSSPFEAPRFLTVPLDGKVLGDFSSTVANFGPHFAPANHVFVGTKNLTYLVDDQEHELLDEYNINPVRHFPGFGFRMFGAQTQFRGTPDDGRVFINVRQYLNFLKRTLKTRVLDLVFQPNNEDLWSLITNLVDDFLDRNHDAGMLFPRNNKSQAYWSKCDDQTNPVEEVVKGDVNCLVGVFPVRIGKRIIFRLSFNSASRSATAIEL